MKSHFTAASLVELYIYEKDSILEKFISSILLKYLLFLSDLLLCANYKRFNQSTKYLVVIIARIMI